MSQYRLVERGREPIKTTFKEFKMAIANLIINAIMGKTEKLKNSNAISREKKSLKLQMPKTKRHQYRAHYTHVNSSYELAGNKAENLTAMIVQNQIAHSYTGMAR